MDEAISGSHILREPDKGSPLGTEAKGQKGPNDKLLQPGVAMFKNLTKGDFITSTF